MKAVRLWNYRLAAANLSPAGGKILQAACMFRTLKYAATEGSRLTLNLKPASPDPTAQKHIKKNIVLRIPVLNTHALAFPATRPSTEPPFGSREIPQNQQVGLAWLG